jgi:hypothetical protein
VVSEDGGPNLRMVLLGAVVGAVVGVLVAVLLIALFGQTKHPAWIGAGIGGFWVGGCLGAFYGLAAGRRKAG